MHEARRTAQAIDAFRGEGVSPELEGMEILLRALAGLQLADQLGNAGILEELEWSPPEQVLPTAVIRTAIKDAERRDKYRSRARKGSAAPARSGAKKP